MASTVLKVETGFESCCICGDGGQLMSPEEHDANSSPMQVPLRTMLLHINNNKVIPDGRLCVSCVRRAIEAYEFSLALGKTTPPLSEKIRALRKKLHELTQKIDVFIVVGGPGANTGGTYSEDDIIMVEKDALAAAAAADEEDLERELNACGENVFQCTICPLTFQSGPEYRAHAVSHGAEGAGVRHSCWTCGAQFLSRAALRDHALLHAAPHSLTCHLCSTTFQCAAALRRHSAACGARCGACGAVAGGRAALAAHVAAAHAHVCRVCFAVLPDAGRRAQHELAHRRADRFVCGYQACVLRFPDRSSLVSHIRTAHAGDPRPAPDPAPATASAACPHCDRTFGSVAAMKRHVRVHRKENHQEEAEWEGAVGAEVAEGGEGGAVEYLELDALDDTLLHA